jgi:hypothetical protein
MALRARKIPSGVMFDFITNSQIPFEFVRYSDVIATPESVLERLSHFCGISPEQPEIAEAIAVIRN